MQHIILPDGTLLSCATILEIAALQSWETPTFAAAVAVVRTTSTTHYIAPTEEARQRVGGCPSGDDFKAALAQRDILIEQVLAATKYTTQPEADTRMAEAKAMGKEIGASFGAVIRQALYEWRFTSVQQWVREFGEAIGKSLKK